MHWHIWLQCGGNPSLKNAVLRFCIHCFCIQILHFAYRFCIHWSVAQMQGPMHCMKWHHMLLEEQSLQNRIYWALQVGRVSWHLKCKCTSLCPHHLTSLLTLSWWALGHMRFFSWWSRWPVCKVGTTDSSRSWMGYCICDRFPMPFGNNA